MSQNAQRTEPRPQRQAAPGFKPVALPALAAAVRSTAQGAQVKRPSPKDLPAILREDALLG